MRCADDLTITTVIPTYRRPQLLQRAVASALTQTYPQVRVSIYDNASGDETGHVMTELMKNDSRVTYDCHPVDIGSYGNFNHGIHSVHTPFFSLLSDDDFLVPDFYARVMECFERYPEAGFVCMPTMVIDGQGRVLSPPMSVEETRFYLPPQGFIGLVNGTLPNTWTGIVFRKEVADVIGPIDTTVGPFADAGYVWRAGARFPFVVAGSISAVLTSHRESTSGTTPPLSSEWPTWWKKMVDSALVLHSRWRDPQAAFADLIPPDYRTIAMLQVMHYLSSDRIDEAAQAATGLRDCGFPLTSRFLRTTTWVSDRLPMLRSLLRFVRDMRKKRLSRRADRNYEMYSHVLSECTAALGFCVANETGARKP